MAGCQKKIDVGDLTLGQSQEEALSILEASQLDLDKWNDSITKVDGEIYLLGIKWNKAHCKFKDGKLVKIAMSRPYSTLSRNSIEAIKEQMRILCGEGFNGRNPEDLVAGYGIEGDNNGCLGGIIIDLEDDVFFALISLSGYAN